MFGFYMYAFSMWLFFSVDGVIKIFGVTGKHFRVYRYDFLFI